MMLKKVAYIISFGILMNIMWFTSLDAEGLEQVISDMSGTTITSVDESIDKLKQIDAPEPQKFESKQSSIIGTLPHSVTRYGELHSSGYVSVGCKVKKMFHNPAYFGTLHAGWVINERIYIGGAVHGLLHPEVVLELTDETITINMVYAGMEIGTIIKISDQFQLRPQLFSGFTSMFYKFTNENDKYGMTGNDTLVIEPSIYTDWMLCDSFMVSLGMGYHFSLGIEGIEGIRNWDINSPTIEILFSFVGW